MSTRQRVPAARGGRVTLGSKMSPASSVEFISDAEPELQPDLPSSTQAVA